jgi:hypothetical protein
MDLRGLHKIPPPPGISDWVAQPRQGLAERAGWPASQNVLDYRQGQPVTEFIGNALLSLGIIVLFGAARTQPELLALSRDILVRS